MQVALYACVSTKDKGQEYENQLRVMREFVQRKCNERWRVSDEYIDRAPVKTADGPAFKRLSEDASRKKFDLLLFWSLNRFSRQGVYETLERVRRLSSQGVEWFSYREEYLRFVGVFREPVRAILATIAKQQRIRISERVTAGLNPRAQDIILGRPRTAVRDERVFDLLDRGMSIREIALQTAGTAITVERILKRAGAWERP